MQSTLCKVPLFLSDVNVTGIFVTEFSKNTQISNFLKIRPVGFKLFHEEGRTDRQSTDMAKLIVFFKILLM